jgi:hypothetical protein
MPKIHLLENFYSLMPEKDSSQASENGKHHSLR